MASQVRVRRATMRPEAGAGRQARKKCSLLLRSEFPVRSHGLHGAEQASRDRADAPGSILVLLTQAKQWEFTPRARAPSEVLIVASNLRPSAAATVAVEDGAAIQCVELSPDVGPILLQLSHPWEQLRVPPRPRSNSCNKMVWPLQAVRPEGPAMGYSQVCDVAATLDVVQHVGGERPSDVGALVAGLHLLSGAQMRGCTTESSTARSLQLGFHAEAVAHQVAQFAGETHQSSGAAESHAIFSDIQGSLHIGRQGQAGRKATICEFT
mmetsp:Transcript_66724/g.217190  ORF Transcript_66724/g.217190 Transcript_66724/m.217190 type:complete len:267 (+) Transcript_66724:359-1159(+)